MDANVRMGRCFYDRALVKEFRQGFQFDYPKEENHMEDILMNTDYSPELQELIELAKPLAKWLYDHKDPHFSIVITEDHVDLVQAVAGSPMTIIK